MMKGVSKYEEQLRGSRSGLSLVSSGGSRYSMQCESYIRGFEAFINTTNYFCRVSEVFVCVEAMARLGVKGELSEAIVVSFAFSANSGCVRMT